MRFGGFAQRKNAIDHGFDHAAFEPRRNRSFEHSRRFDFFFDRSGPQYGADDLQSFDQQRTEVEFRARSPGQTDDDNASSFGRGGDGFRNVRAADEIQHDVDSTAVRAAAYGFGKLGVCHDNPVIQSERFAALEFVRSAARSDDGASKRASNLNARRAHAASGRVNEHRFAGLQSTARDESDTRRAHAASGCMNEHRFAGLQSTARDESIISRDKRFRRSRDNLVAQTGRSHGHFALVHDNIFGIRRSADEPINAFAAFEAGCAFTERIDRARIFKSRNIGGNVLRGRVVPCSLEQIRSIHARMRYTHAHVPVRRLYLRDVAYFENFGAAGRTNRNNTHGFGSCGFYGVMVPTVVNMPPDAAQISMFPGASPVSGLNCNSPDAPLTLMGIPETRVVFPVPQSLKLMFTAMPDESCNIPSATLLPS